MTPFISGILSWLKTKFPSATAFPAPNDELIVRVGTRQYQIYFVTNKNEAFTAASRISQEPLRHPATQKVGVIVADSKATAADPQVQSAINSNYSDTCYLGFLQYREVKKWPSTAP